MTAMSQDEVWASLVLDLEQAGESTPPAADAAPTVLHYSPVMARLDMIADRVLAVRTAVQAGYSKDHQEPSWEPIPRPETALDRERDRRARNLLLEQAALILGEGLSISSE